MGTMQTRYEALGVTAFALVGDAGREGGGVCASLQGGEGDTEGAQHGLSFQHLAYATGGGVGSICVDNYGPFVTTMADRVVGGSVSFPLHGYPIVSSLRVAVDGALLWRNRDSGWSYDSAANGVVLHGIPLRHDSNIAVAYLMWLESEG